jgi:hypothetical protein
MNELNRRKFAAGAVQIFLIPEILSASVQVFFSEVREEDRHAGKQKPKELVNLKFNPISFPEPV